MTVIHFAKKGKKSIKSLINQSTWLKRLNRKKMETKSLKTPASHNRLIFTKDFALSFQILKNNLTK